VQGLELITCGDLIELSSSTRTNNRVLIVPLPQSRLERSEMGRALSLALLGGLDIYIGGMWKHLHTYINRRVLQVAPAAARVRPIPARPPPLA
jgi:hypothetical protein